MRRLRSKLLWAVGLVIPLLAAPPVHAVQTADPVRILLVGDSVTQGSAGDWTWRYRLWQHFEESGVPVDFVGPRDDLYDNVTATQGSTAYADPDFDRDHAARWGMMLGAMDVPIGQLVATYHPDVVVEMLGVNDLIAPSLSPPDVVAAGVQQLVTDARAADPGVDIVLGQVTQTWFAGVADFDSRLDDVAAATTTAESQVVVARTAAGYDQSADTWDGSHPNARGEMRIAAAMADALHELGVGPVAARPLVMPPVGPRTGARLAVTPSSGQALLRWSGPPGATGEYVWVRDRTRGDPWRRLPAQLPVDGRPGGSWTAQLLVDGHHYDFRLQPVKGSDAGKGVFSNVVDVVPAPPPAAPRPLDFRAGRRCAELRWDAPAWADRYQVQLLRTRRWRELGWTSRTRYVARRLPLARTWRLRVRAWHATVGGGMASRVVPRASGTC